MNSLWKSCLLDAHPEEYCSGIFSDVLDKLGYRKQVISGWKLNHSRARMFGRARTLVLETIETDDERIRDGLGFLVGLNESDILVVKGSMEYAYFGELMTRLSMRTGLSGTVIDGLTRDTFYTQQQEYPVFAKGYTPVDIKGRGRVKGHSVPVEIDGVLIRPGDVLFGDSDAVVVIPSDVFLEALPRFNAAVLEEVKTKKLIFNNTSIDDILKFVKEF